MGSFPILGSIVTQVQVLRRLGETNLGHHTPKTELNAVLVFSTPLCHAVLNPAGNGISPLRL